MFDGNSSDDPNPFAFAAQRSRPKRGKALLSSLKFLFVVAVVLAATMVLGSHSRRWLVSRIANDFGTLSETEKQLRLTQLNALGVSAIDSMVGILCDEDDSVARTAYDMLRTQQNDWNLLDRAVAIKRNKMLVDAMDAIAPQIKDDRTVWTTGLLQQSIALSVNRQDAPSKELYAAATTMLDRMALSERSGPSILVEDVGDFDSPRPLTVRSEPLPVPASESLDDWTQWPPVENAPAVVYRSSASTLQPVPEGEQIAFGDVNASATELPYVAAETVQIKKATPKFASGVPQTQAEVRPVAMLVESPLETYDTKSVIYWLGNSHQPLRSAAKDELIRRGLSEEEIGIATRIAAGDVQTKLDLVDFIVRNGTLDPRPWLLLLMNDPSRDVKLKTVAVLATIKDPAVENELRNHIVDEPDPTVAFRIRRLLDLR